VTAAEPDGFVEDGPERAKGYEPPDGFWRTLWSRVWGWYPDRTRDDWRKLWSRHG
jgi:hypothetical protein